jgi:glycosyltransferase involved in cell wall biosynthesis
MVANFNPYKDHDTLLRAWRTVVESTRKRGVNAMLVLAGQEEGIQISSLRSLASELGIADNIRFLGHVVDISGLLSAVDIGVFSSSYEGCPNGVLEGMAAGLPVVATDIDGIREAVGPGGYRHLFPPGNAELLAERVVELASRPELRAEEGEVNRRRIQEEFDGRAMASKMVELFEYCLGSR